MALPRASGGSGVRCGRVLSSCYQERVSFLATKMSYRNAVAVFNVMTGREGTADELSLATFSSDVEFLGARLIAYKESLAGAVLAEHHFPDTGRCPGNGLPPEYRTAPHKTITIKPSEIMGYTEDSFSKEFLNPGPGQAEGDFSKPDMEEYPAVKIRRTSRKSLSPAEAENACRQYVLSNNSRSRDTNKWVLHPFEFEADSSEVLYISIDAVLVPEQCGTRVAGGKSRQKDKKTFISHWNIRLEFDNTHYSATSADKDEAYRETLAVMLANRLYNKYIVFFTDGERCIFDDIGTYFSPWEHTVYLDWFHLQEKVFSLMTMIIKAERVIDPHGRTEYYKRGARKGEVKSQEMTSLSRLYARELCLILWYGNTAEALTYLNRIKPDVVKSQHWLNELIAYIKNKEQWITCFALRKKAGLRNSSNGVENQNMVTVSNRQKKKGMSWRERGSAVLASLTALFDNCEATEWFYNNRFSFQLNNQYTC